MDCDAHELARPLVSSRRSVAIVGGGWAGLAAAIEATRCGNQVTLFEMGPQLGGRSRGVKAAEMMLDNGQHILIGAYTQTLALLQTVGVDLAATLLRTPLRMTYPDGTGLQLVAGAPILAFVRAVICLRGWHWRDRLSLLAAASGWVLRGFRCNAAVTVSQHCRRLPQKVLQELIEPLCVAALNTPASDASAAIFLRVLKDALFSGAGSADLLLPRVSLSELLPLPAAQWLEAAGAQIELSCRVNCLVRHNDRWLLNNTVFDQVVLATTAAEAARLVREVAPAWSRAAAALHYEPIMTVYLHSEGARLPEPMLALRADASAPAQFVFDRGQLGGPAGLLAFVISGAQPWVDAGQATTLQATLAQAHAVLGAFLRGPLEPVKVIGEKRATFRCTPSLERSPMLIATGLHAAGDHVIGPYPATLEGAVRSGIEAVRALA